MPGPLHGIRIVDLTTMISGPLATMILADQGADVIKVEAPTGGDHTRQVATRRNGMSAAYLNNNRNKRSIVLDLKAPDGLAAALRLVETADVFIQNFRPGVTDRLGLGAEALLALNRTLVHVSIAGFGFDGPFADKPVFDPLIQSLSGLTTVQAGRDDARPKLVRTILPDKLTGYATAQAICAALIARGRTGAGQAIRISMLDTVLAFLWSSDMGGHTFIGDEVPTETAQSFIDLIYDTADGYISVAVMRHKDWAGLARAAGRPDWLDDPRFQDSEGLDTHKHARLEMTRDMLRHRSTADWIARLDAEGVPCAPVLTRREALRHPQVIANGLIIETDHPVAGRLRQARPAPHFSGTPADCRRGAPGLGDDTRTILAEAGYGAADIAALLASGAAAAAPGNDAEDAA